MSVGSEIALIPNLQANPCDEISALFSVIDATKENAFDGGLRETQLPTKTAELTGMKPQANKIIRSAMNHIFFHSPFKTLQSFDFQLKLMVIGDRNCGKTSFLLQLMQDQPLQENKKVTIGTDFRTRYVTFAWPDSKGLAELERTEVDIPTSTNRENHMIDSEEPKNVRQSGLYDLKLQIFDKTGSEKFITVTSSYYRSHGIFFLYDVCDYNTFETVRDYWIPQAFQYADAKTLVFIIVGMKIDLIDQEDETSTTSKKTREVSIKEGIALANLYSMPFIECSNKTTENVTDALSTLLYYVLENLSKPTKEEEAKPKNRKHSSCDIS